MTLSKTPAGHLVKLLVLAVAASVVAAPAASASPAKPAFGPFIDEGSYYDGQSKCSPYAKPGVVAFQRMVLDAYPGTGVGGISRDCSVGGTSEHKEGRAWDWGVNVGNDYERRSANDLLDWLARRDGYGNTAAMARRLGIMYAIWNKRIWFPGSGWRTYCVQRNGACRDPEDGGARHPHTDHVHFSFTWPGARKQTTFWQAPRTYAAGAAATPWGGVWVAGLNGGIRTLGSAGYYGSKAAQLKNTSAAALAARPSGDGYWMLTKTGRVFSLGGARGHGYEAGIRAVDIAATPSGKGYWVLARGGRVIPFGDATKFGSVASTEGPVVSMTPTASGAGYWVLGANGTVHVFGDAQHLGDAAEGAVDIARTASSLGYWVAMADGSVRAFGDAAALGGLSEAPDKPIVDLLPTPTGAGYWLVTAKASARPFGDATTLSAKADSTTYATSIDQVLNLITE